MNNFDPRGFDFDIFKPWGLMCHFATAGGSLPLEILANPFHKQIRSFLRGDENKIRFRYKVNPNIEEIFSLKNNRQEREGNEFDRERYLRDFIDYASRGVFSFDRTHIDLYDDMKFHLVAYPIFDEQFEEFILKLKKFKVCKNLPSLHNIFLNDIEYLNNIISKFINTNLLHPVDFRHLFVDV